MPFNPNAAYLQVGTDTGQVLYLQSSVYYDQAGNVVTLPFTTNGPSNIVTPTEFSVKTGAKTMVNGDTIFTATDDVQILNLISECITANDGTLSTVQYSITPAVGSATAISGASASLASLQPGSVIVLNNNNVGTAPAILTTSVGIGSNSTTGMLFMAGTLKLVIAVGSTTGTWTHYIRYRPLAPSARVIANQ